ncbi:ATP-binding protein [Kribbella catacumbae]|uniref:ATP-binding protein n=1 Tax=Kribbella catacumbae TaxID=460086 RepID=UPI00037F204B|nr:ATP-binding protein [Kribbella catacumbae]
MTASRLTVQVDQDHLERLVKRPITGIAELIWNALDADATKVDCEVVDNGLGGADSLRVIDNGRGMNRERIDIDFSQLGGSWKKLTANTPDGRQLHGRAGQGRFSAFAIGETVVWTSIADAVVGPRREIVVTGRRTSLRDFDVSDVVVAADRDTGTVVECTNLTSEAETYLLRDDVIDELAAIFAFILEKYPIDITWRGTPVDPESLQLRRENLSLSIEGITGAELDIIEWRKPAKRALHLCDSSGVSLHEMAPGIRALGFEFTSYIRWDGFKDLQSQLVLEEMDDTDVATVINAGRDALREYFKKRASDKGGELIKAWKEEKTYPFNVEPATVVEKTERDLFNILAITTAPVVEAADVKSRKLSLRLLREAIEKSPGTVHEVLQEVLNLPEDRLQELRDLVEATSLGSIISAARRVTDRLDFIQGLEQILFDGVLRKHTLERSQLHRILANETWLFKEEYALTADDVTLRTALKDHIGLLGREDLVPSDLDAEVLDADGRRIVVDLMLSRITEQAHNERENIVIELKRPSVHIGSEQLSQIQNYASTVKADARFNGTDSRWEFWIVGDELTESAKDQANQQNREPGIVNISTDGKYIVRAVTWGKILQDAKHRLAFIRAALEYTSDTDRGIEYLRRAYGRYLPNAALASDSPTTGINDATDIDSSEESTEDSGASE